jgi:deoxyribose-phosphate aldolase
VEQLVDQITQQVIASLRGQNSASPSSGTTDDCADGRCVADRPERVQRVVSAGASRISSKLGTLPADTSIASMIDHTLLKPDTTAAEIAQLCHEARTYHFASVCINPTYVKLSADLLKGSDVKVCTVIGFPLGATPPDVKSFEAQQALRDGASEIDMVINVGALRSGDYKLVLKDIGAVSNTAHAANAICKVILETSMLDDEQKVVACQLAKVAGADFVKTSTGFGGGGATVADVTLMRYVVGRDMGVKASGGVRTLQDAQAMIAAGATRIGASAGVRIVKETLGQNVSNTLGSTY